MAWETISKIEDKHPDPQPSSLRAINKSSFNELISYSSFTYSIKCKCWLSREKKTHTTCALFSLSRETWQTNVGELWNKMITNYTLFPFFSAPYRPEKGSVGDDVCVFIYNRSQGGRGNLGLSHTHTHIHQISQTQQFSKTFSSPTAHSISPPLY